MIGSLLKGNRLDLIRDDSPPKKEYVYNVL